MNDTSEIHHIDLPVFPTTAPELFTDPETTKAMFGPVFVELADVVAVPPDAAGEPTPCEGFDVAALQQHVLAWIQFFASALNDPAGGGERLDPETWTLGSEEDPGVIVRAAAAGIDRAIDAGVAGDLVAMSQARMRGDGVLAMALGEYLIHGWDLAVATGRSWTPAEPNPANDAAALAALAFFQNMVQPEYRGPDSGLFDEEIPAPADATPFERLLCFAGRRLPEA